MIIEITRDNEALLLLQDREFLDTWGNIWKQCPWATSFQGPDFCTAWFDVYREQFKPLLVISCDDLGNVNGLLPLAVPYNGRGVVVAGAWQAEYQCWISMPEIIDSFPWLAIQKLKREFGVNFLTFQYLPPKTPLGWLSNPAPLKTCRVIVRRRPLLRFGDGNEISRSLNKKSNKDRIKRLSKMGPMEVKRITSPDDLELLFDDIISWYDFRQMALHGRAPFQEDTLKKTFHLTMMKTPGLLDVTILKFGNCLAAAHIGVCSGKEVHLGIVAHNPLMARHSPGKFLILLMSKSLMEEGSVLLDLTPGDDPYKDRFANANDEVHTLTIFLSGIKRFKESLRYNLKNMAKKMLETVDIKPVHLKSWASKIKRFHSMHTFSDFTQNIHEWIGQQREIRVYFYELSKACNLDVNGTVQRDVFQELLMCEPRFSHHFGDGLVLTWLNRLEDGHHVYTISQEGQLLHFGWLSVDQNNYFINEVNREYILPPNSLFLFDFYTFPKSRNRGLFTMSLKKMLKDASQSPSIGRVYIAVAAYNGAARHVIEKFGFIYEVSLFSKTRFGRVYHWESSPGKNRT